MAKFLLVGRKFINIDSVDYIDLGEEDKSTITVYFNGPADKNRSIQFTGDEASELWEKLEEETTLGTSEPRP
jgi:hypothetical protein